MRNPSFTLGVLLGGAFVAAVLNDTFREKCRQGLVYLGNEASGQLGTIMAELSGKPTNIKEQHNGNNELLQP